MTHIRYTAFPWLLYLTLSVGATAAERLSEIQQSALLNAANQAFEQALDQTDEQQAQGKYQQSIEAYEQLVASGLQNGKLYYNLGNAYFLRNYIGHAILQYRRGLQLEPGNRRLQANLQYARQQRIDQIDPSEQPALVSRLLFFWHDDISLTTQVTLALIGFLLIWTSAFAHLFWPRPAYLWLIAGTAVAFVLFGSSSWVVHAQNTTHQYGVVIAAETPVRKGNGTSYTLQFPHPLHSGAEFSILEIRRSWLHIQLDNGSTGWIRKTHAAIW